MCSDLHPQHATESGLGEVVFFCNLAKRKRERKKKKKTKHVLIAVRTQKVK